jgi:hypothetical protein
VTGYATSSDDLDDVGLDAQLRWEKPARTPMFIDPQQRSATRKTGASHLLVHQPSVNSMEPNRGRLERSRRSG